MKSKKKAMGIVMDEIDGMNSSDKGGLTELMSVMFSKKNIQSNRSSSKKLFDLINSTEKKSLLDYTYWETKILHQINNKSTKNDFERNFINLVILTKNNVEKKRTFKLFF